MRHLISLFDMATSDIEEIFDLSAKLKKDYQNGIREPRFHGRVLALLFQKPSLRTRVSFESAFAHLGGTSLYLGSDVGWGKRESISDFASVLSEYVDAIVCRSKSHETLVEFAGFCSC